MSIDTFDKRQASHRFGHGATTRRPSGASSKFLRGTALGAYSQDVIVLEPSDTPSDGWTFGSEVRTLSFESPSRTLLSGSSDKVLVSSAASPVLRCGRQDTTWRFRR